MKDDIKTNHSRSEKLSEPSELASTMEIVQQMLLNYLEDVGSLDDLHLFGRWYGSKLFLIVVVTLASM